MTQLERTKEGNLLVTVTMPSIEVGTVGGGTHLTAQGACLDMMGGLKGPHPTVPGGNSSSLARICAGIVMAGEISLMAALTSGDLMRSHLEHNRSFSSGANTPSAAVTAAEDSASLTNLRLRNIKNGVAGSLASNLSDLGRE